MGVRRQIYLDESDDRLLEEQSRKTGLSVSELIRQAIHECYGPGQRLSWDEVFAYSVQPNSSPSEAWAYDTIFDREFDDMLEAEFEQKPDDPATMGRA